jgi:hypothetical protein
VEMGGGDVDPYDIITDHNHYRGLINFLAVNSVCDTDSYICCRLRK